MKIHIILAMFLVLQIGDISFTSIGLSKYGQGYEKNILMSNIIEKYGFLTVAVIKFAASLLIVFGILQMFKKFEAKRKYFLTFSIILCLIPLYGIFTFFYIYLL